jgi:tetratricopeptide (TPR) repeat protein
MLAAEDDRTEAEKLFERAISLNPSHAGAYERLAQCGSADNRHERAVQFLERAHQLDPSNLRVTWQLALATQSTGGEFRPAIKTPAARPIDAAAIERLGEAIVAEPDFVQAFLSLPVTEADGEVFSALAATLESALRQHSEFADLHYHCGMVYRRLGRDKDAIQHAEQAVQLNPRYVGALVLLAQLYSQTDRCADAMQRLEQALQAGGDYPDVHYLLGRMSQTTGQFARARQAYERALDLNKHYSAAREALAALPS